MNNVITCLVAERKVDGVTMQAIKSDVSNFRFVPNKDERNKRIYSALRKVTNEGKVFWCLADTPGQLEDYIVLLVDDRTVVSFELLRDSNSADPCEIKVQAVDEYRRGISDLGKAKLCFALEFAREALNTEHS